MAGINRARSIQKSESVFASAAQAKPCIFLSHISIDQKAAEAVGDYIMDSGDIDIYLDVKDEALQRAVRNGDAHAVTEFIEKGLAKSTHVMCLVTEDTVRSWWVPYELGYAKRANKPLSSLFLKDTVTLPEYLSISRVIRGTKSLNFYLHEIMRENMRMILESALITHTASPHPLDSVLNWNA